MFGLERCGAIQSSLQVGQKNIKNLGNIRVLQREGKILEAEDFTPLTQTSKVVRCVSASGPRTRSKMLQNRREQSVAELKIAYGDL